MINEDYCFRDIDDSIGKGLFALRDFRKGELIFRERPVVSTQFSWNRDYGYAACQYCLSPLETARDNVVRLSSNPNIILPETSHCHVRPNFHVRCPECGEGYCSTQCLNDAFQSHHSFLCGNKNARKVDLMWKEMHYPPETCSITLLLKILANLTLNKEEFPSIVAGFVQDAQVDGVAHKLFGESWSSQVEKLRIGVSEVFASYPELGPYLTPDGFTRLFALVGRNAQGIGTSAFAPWCKRFLAENSTDKKMLERNDFIDVIYKELDESAGLDFLNNEGSGLYTLQSGCNHSCEPNAVVEFPHNNFELVLCVRSAIKAGEEIRISYLDECQLERSRHSRRKTLLEYYLFACSCSKCDKERDQPDLTSEEDTSDEEMVS